MRRHIFVIGQVGGRTCLLLSRATGAPLCGEICPYGHLSDNKLDRFMEFALCIGRLRHRYLMSVHDVIDDIAGSSCIIISDYRMEALSLVELCARWTDLCESPDAAFVIDIYCQLLILVQYLHTNIPDVWHYIFFTRMLCLSKLRITRLGEIALELSFGLSPCWFGGGDAQLNQLFIELGLEYSIVPVDVKSSSQFSRNALSWIIAVIVFTIALSGPFPEIYSPHRQENYSALTSFTKLPKIFSQELCLAMEHSVNLRTAFATLLDSASTHAYYLELHLRKGWDMLLTRGHSQLVTSVIEDDIPGVILYKVFDCKIEDEHGVTALMKAVSYNNIPIARILAQFEAGHADIHGNCATEQALLLGKLEVAQVLEPFEHLALAFAGYTELMLYILRYTDDPRKEDKLDRIQVLESLIDKHKLRVTHQNHTALMIAVIVGDLQAMELLVPIESGIRDLSGLAAINYAIKFNNQRAYQVLEPLETISDDSGNTPLHELAYHNRYESLQYFHQFTGKLNNQSMSALMLAARCNNVESVRYLAKYEAGMRMQNRVFYGLNYENATAMMIAAYHGYEEVVRILLPYEARYRDTHSLKTALMAAAMGGQPHIVSCLLEAEGGMANKSGYTALMLASIHNNLECVLILAQKEAKMVSKAGELAIELASKKGHMDIVNALLKYEQVPNNKVDCTSFEAV